jgi:hypothetical protein
MTEEEKTVELRNDCLRTLYNYNKCACEVIGMLKTTTCTDDMSRYVECIRKSFMLFDAHVNQMVEKLNHEYQKYHT